jgi:hypothetical protein
MKDSCINKALNERKDLEKRAERSFHLGEEEPGIVVQ